MVDKEKSSRTRSLMLSGGLITMLIYIASHEACHHPEPVESPIPELIDLSTEGGGKIVTIMFTTIDLRDHWYSSGRKRYIRILVDDKEVVSRECDFYWGAPIFPAVYDFTPKVKVNLGKHKITIEDRYYNVSFTEIIEITEGDLDYMGKCDGKFLILEFDAPARKIRKLLIPYL